jgi:hypothetical protein
MDAMSTVAPILLEAACWGLACAIIGTVYATVVAGERSPLDPWFDLLGWMDDRTGWLAPLSWIAKPLGACAKCVSGWLAMFACSISFPWSLEPLSIAFHLLAASCAVIFANALTEHYRWTRNRM